ncbi:hypothetical protein EZS27_025439 [termite gut metagenome]|uniref:Double-GTPase 1 domain-containing protein n=1 Tax=termite gut metagenome TaxID=433724 RepID=A0A5J4QU23_9ZZZZ
MFFIRLNDIPETEDIVNRPLPEKVSVKDKGKSPFKLSDNAFYIELLQMLLYAKKVSNKQNIVIPRLMIVLSCWDLLNAEGIIPSEILKSKLPMFYKFITNSWDKNNLYIVGLSSTEKTLDSKIPDNDYLDKNPESFGYAIFPDGTKEKDLTMLISKIIGQ